MNILALPGSARKNSSNLALLTYLQIRYPSLQLKLSHSHFSLPLFHSAREDTSDDNTVTLFKKELRTSEKVLICSPEYLHNLPAGLKNMFEWCNATGEFADKTVLPIIYSPAPPRGEKAMQSMLWSLDALNAKVPGSLLIHHTEIAFTDSGSLEKNSIEELLDTTIELLTG